MNQPAFAALAAQQLAGAVGQHLVHIHIALCARAGLPDHQGEFFRVLVLQHLIGSGQDGFGFFLVQQPQLVIDGGAGAFDQGQRVQQFARLLFAADGKVDQRALRLRSPQALRRDGDGAKAVGFHAGVGHRATPCMRWRSC